MCSGRTQQEIARQALIESKELTKRAVSARMRRALADSGLTIREASAASGISKTTLICYLNGTSCPDIASLSFFAATVGESLGELLGGSF